jgi:predicted transcriptional regulator
MAAAKYTKAERDALLLKIAQLLNRGRRVTEIARELGMTNALVTYYADRLKKGELERAHDEVKAYRTRLLEELREVKAEAWNAWDASKTKEICDEEGNTLVAQVEPNPQFLQLVRGAIDDERTLMGLDVPVAKEVNMNGVVDFRAFFASVPEFVPDDVEAEVRALNTVASNDPPANGSGKAHANGKNGKH